MRDIPESVNGYSDGDVDTNPSTTIGLGDLIAQRYSRRATLRSGATAAGLAVFGGAFLAACDDAGNSTDSPPVVTAGSSGNASAGRLVTLVSTVTDDDGIVTSAWTQVSGPTVALAGATTDTATFVAPAVSAGTQLVFRYTATDQGGQSSSADTTVTIAPAQLGFTAVPKNLLDLVTVPTGYSVSVLTALGEPLATGVATFANNGTDTNYAQRIGDHGDALHFYGLNSEGTRDPASNSRGLLVQNHENISVQYLHASGPTALPAGPRPEAEAIKEIEAHGVSIAEISFAAGAGFWGLVSVGALNRRITPNTPVAINGPVRGTAFVQTAFSADGTLGRGTINNCANGVTPWGTNLTCEENWGGYFRRPAAADNPRRTAKEVTAFTRYGINSTNGNYAWASVVPADAANTLFRRWDAQATGASATADFRNEPNQFGWVVEIDPYNKDSVPRKRTALGRFNHEGAWPGRFAAGVRPAWYMGDDARGEYFYKFVSATPWVAADAQATDRLAIGDKYLDTGTLYVARFNADGTGEWLPLVFGQGPLTAANATYPFASQADVLLHARLAADAVGATPMDRPEWTATNPVTGEVYLTLTNNTQRTPATADPANPRAYEDPLSNARGNVNGHIVRIRDNGDSTEATAFAWDIYLFGAGSDFEAANVNLSGLTADNDFSSPDGMWFGRSTNVSGQISPLVWIQTDDGAYTTRTNNQMLAAFPGTTGDGGTRTVTNSTADGTSTVTTRIGAAPGALLRRFLVGPKECEITGVDSTPDGTTLFVGIQHPGENGTTTTPTSAWPVSQTTATPPAGTRPRSGVVAIRRGGAIVGL